MSGNIRPMHGMVLLRVDERAVERPGSKIIMPDTAKGRPNQAVVVASSRGWWQNGRFIESELKVDDHVIFNPYKISLVLADGQLAGAQGTPIAKPGEECLVHELHVLTLIETDT